MAWNASNSNNLEPLALKGLRATDNRNGGCVVDGQTVVTCSHRRRGRDKTVLSGPRRQCEHNCRQDETVLSCPCRRCEQANSCELETGSRRDKTHRNWVETRQSCLVGGVRRSHSTDTRAHSVIFVNENENGEKRENNEFVNEN